ncbi:SDR family NAD(P)-dependent oxidoreductase [Amylibacter sp. SFDW26]|uniref:SDR family NAD(P)-dependent oxidoreductase n=1 Tax=Amylibacter sp. SFDW26 TaxID=2652722 RepID=UPI00186A93C5|nr:SDR family oxidoreductase [Amylibacter sp. SFDW26]
MQKNLFSVEGKTICVTGASSGIGRAVSTMLCEAGANVIAVARRADALQQWKDEAVGNAEIVAADLSDIDTLPDLALDICKPFGPVDVLINAAGLNTRQHADAVTFEGWRNTLDINLNAPFFLAQSLVPMMKEKGWGRIINFGSLQSRRAFANGIAYGASKGGVDQLTRAMAEAWSKDGITANALAPGFFPTELTAPVFGDSELADKNANQTCIGRNGTMDDLTGPVLFLCSDASNYVTGQMLYVDGGFTAK